jgi:hypothetical protein
MQQMTSRERVLSAFERTGYDRIPIKHEGTPGGIGSRCVRRGPADHAADRHRGTPKACRRPPVLLRQCLRSEHPGLRFGTPQEVEREVKRRLALFPKGGLFLGPTHAIQVGSPLENILALCRTAGSLMETIDDSIRVLGKATEQESTKVNMSKLF